MSFLSTRTLPKKTDRPHSRGKIEQTYSAHLKYSNEQKMRNKEQQMRSKEQQTQTSKTIIQLAQEELNRMNSPPEADINCLHFERKSDIFNSTLEMSKIDRESKSKGLSLTRLFLSKHADTDEKHFQVASTIDQQELAKPPNETTIEEVFKVPQWSRFTIREIRVKSIDAANNLLIQDYKKASSTGSVPSIDLDEDPMKNVKSQVSTARRGRSLSPTSRRTRSRYSADSTSGASSDSVKQRDIFHGLIANIKSSDWNVSLKSLMEIAERAASIDHHRIYSHMTEINQKLIEFLRSPRSQVCRAACQIAGSFFEAIKDTRRPEFDDIVELLLMKTADSNKFIRKDANLALDALIMNISYIHTIRAISQKGPAHKNDLIRITSARLYVCIVGIAGVNVIMTHVGNDGTRQRIIENMVIFIRDKNIKAREYGVRLYKLLHENPNFEYFLKKFIDKSRISEIKKIIKKV